MQLHDKRFIVPGGTSGIGASAVRAYAREGARVISLDVNDDLGMTVVDEACQGATHPPLYLHCDVCDHDEVSSAFAHAAESMGGLDVLAHVAGIERCTPADVIDADECQAVFRTNVWGTMSTNQAALQGMRDGGGSIINFSSGAGIQGLAGRGNLRRHQGCGVGVDSHHRARVGAVRHPGQRGRPGHPYADGPGRDGAPVRRRTGDGEEDAGGSHPAWWKARRRGPRHGAGDGLPCQWRIAFHHRADTLCRRRRSPFELTDETNRQTGTDRRVTVGTRAGYVNSR